MGGDTATQENSNHTAAMVTNNKDTPKKKTKPKMTINTTEGASKTQYKTALRKEIIGTFAGLFNSRSNQGDLSIDSSPSSNSPDYHVYSKPVYNLRKHVENLRASKGSHQDNLNLEFESLKREENGMRFHSTCIAANAPENKPKNRYSSVLPNEHTRVRLSVLPEEKGTDYINANFVNGEEFDIDLSYIATQAPLPSTFNDFWRMIWEQQAPIILILANEEPEEDAFRGPCLSKYWPDEGEKEAYGPIGVKTLNQQQYDTDIILRSLELTKSDCEESHHVSIIQFVGWPDHGVPSDFRPVRTLFELLETFDSEISHSKPIVTHCSAGIGRTGTFCTIHILRLRLQEHLKKYGNETPFPFNVYTTVKKLKSQRIGMVQTPEQYEFCYEMVLAEAEDLGFKFPSVKENTSTEDTPPPTPHSGPITDAFAFQS